MSKKLVVYYSYQGHTRQLAQAMASEIDADLLEIKPVKEMNLKGFSAYAWGGFRAIMAARPELQPWGVNPADYELILIGGPVWAFTYAPPLRSFFQQAKLTKKRVAVFASCEGGLGKTLQNMARALSGNEVLAQTYFVWKSDNDAAGLCDEARGWARETAALAQL